MKIKEIIRTLTIAWSHDVIPLLAVASVAGAVDLNFSSASTLEIWDPFGPQSNGPIFSAHVDHKFHALAWLSPFDDYANGVLVAALETGLVEFYNVETLIKKGSLQSATIHSSTKHSGVVKSLLFNPLQPHILASGGLQGQIYVWDLKTFAEPFIPGRPMTPMDEISCVAWNNSVPHIMASTSNSGYTSIWDLKLKREVLHLSYNGSLGRADFSHVAWHPTQLTKLITSSQSDLCPIIMLWDLRNASEPENILQGHTKGVLSLDWCAQDPNLLISSGKDNTTMLWNPIAGIKLGEYPSAANWAFLTRFAPRAPDVIATASFDSKIIIQTLQDTSPPVSEKVRSNNEDEFWSNIATTEVQQAVFEVQQAPAWLKRPCTASFGFGAKLVAVNNSTGKGQVSVSKFLSQNPANDVLSELLEAIKSDDYSKILEARLSGSSSDKADWEVLLKLQIQGKGDLFKTLVDEVPTEPSLDLDADLLGEEAALEPENDDAFFSSLSKDIKDKKSADIYVPTGPFKIIQDTESQLESRLAKLLLNYKIPEAVSLCLEEGKLTEALILALDQSEDIRKKVKNHYFSQSGSNVTSRLIYSASYKDISDIVANADISDWKDIAASVAAFCKDQDDFNHRMVELGDRIMQNDSASRESRNDAFTCYLAGNALDKVSAIWLGDLPELEETLLRTENERISSPHDARYLALAGFVEKLSVYRSISQLGGPLEGPAIEPVCEAIFEFTNMAASSGYFELADQFMAILPEDFAGLKTEKDRIAKATSNSPKKQANVPGNGHAARTGRYSGGLKPSLAAPMQLGIPPRAPSSNAVPLSQSYSAAGVNGAANPYVPAAPAQTHAAPAYNPYNPNPEEKRPSFSGMQPSGAPVGVVRPPATPSFTQSNLYGPSAVGAYNNAPQASVAPPPPTAPNKNETDGWNDLPDTFKAAKPAARRQAGATTYQGLGFVSPLTNPVAHSPKPPQAPTPKPLAPRVPLAQVQPPPPVSRVASAQVQPPAPKNRVVTKGSNPGTPRPGASARYAPAEPASPAHSSSGLVSNAPMGGSLSAAPKGAPKNPYAPTATAPAKITYAAPPLNNFVAPTASKPVLNPYTPSPTNTPSFAPRRPGPSRSISSQSAGQKSAGPSRQTSQVFAPPPPVTRAAGGSRRGSQSSNPYQPKLPNVAGRSGTSTPAGTPPMGVAPPPSGLAPPPTGVAPPPTGVAPPPTGLAPPPVAAPLAGAPPLGTAFSTPPIGGRSGQPTASQFAAPAASKSPNPYAPPANGTANGPASNAGAHQYAPPPQTQPAQGPPKQSSSGGVTRNAPHAATNQHAQSELGGPQMAAPLNIGPPVSQAAAPAPPAPASAPAPPAPAVAKHDTETAEASAAQQTAGQASSIQNTFTAILGRIQPQAPPKYAKHVADMDKRLKLLFSDLNHGKVSPAAVGLLSKVASSLDAKDFANAAALNQELSTNNAAEAGNWLTGIKRLVTMAEAFDS